MRKPKPRKPKPLLTPRQTDAMNALIKHGCGKLAADSLGMALKTFECHIVALKKRTGIRHTLHAVLAHDRATRQEQVNQGASA